MIKTSITLRGTMPRPLSPPQKTYPVSHSRWAMQRHCQKIFSKNAFLSSNGHVLSTYTGEDLNSQKLIPKKITFVRQRTGHVNSIHSEDECIDHSKKSLNYFRVCRCRDLVCRSIHSGRDDVLSTTVSQPPDQNKGTMNRFLICDPILHLPAPISLPRWSVVSSPVVCSPASAGSHLLASVVSCQWSPVGCQWSVVIL